MSNMINNSKKVAIITRTKNRNLLLERAIKSVEAQDYDNYIHLVLNDGGDCDAFKKIVKKYKSSKRIFISNIESVGLVRALNQAIKNVDAEYISILDDDDTWDSKRLTKAIDYMTASNNSVVVVKMGLVIEEIAEDNNIKKISESLHPESGEGEISLYKQCYKNYLSNGVILYKKCIYDEIGSYDESLETAEDWDFGIRLLLNYDVGFLNTSSPLVYYHQRPLLKGSAGNSVHKAVDTQERTINIIRNKYLRKDINQGVFGIGYIMNDIPIKLDLVKRLEGHVNFVNSGVNMELNKQTVYITNIIKTLNNITQILEDRLINKVIRKIKRQS